MDGFVFVQGMAVNGGRLKRALEQEAAREGAHNTGREPLVVSNHSKKKTKPKTDKTKSTAKKTHESRHRSTSESSQSTTVR